MLKCKQWIGFNFEDYRFRLSCTANLRPFDGITMNFPVIGPQRRNIDVQDGYSVVGRT
jgi:hypothetical protein